MVFWYFGFVVLRPTDFSSTPHQAVKFSNTPGIRAFSGFMGLVVLNCLTLELYYQLTYNS